MRLEGIVFAKLDPRLLLLINQIWGWTCARSMHQSVVDSNVALFADNIRTLAKFENMQRCLQDSLSILRLKKRGEPLSTASEQTVLLDWLSAICYSGDFSSPSLFAKDCSAR